MKFAAAIFDLDGTIIESEWVWGKAYASVFKKLGVTIPDNYSHTPGVSIRSNLINQLSKYNIKTDKHIDELAALTFIEYQKLIPEIKLKEGILEFMDILRENGTPLALATSTNWETADKVLISLGLRNVFETITTVEEVTNPKPAPDIYLLTSEKLGVEPGDCLAFEDSPTGVTSAHDAGMKVVAVNDDERVAEKLQDADLIVDSFSEITLKAIDAIGED